MAQPWPVLELAPEQRQALERIVRRGADWKARERAQTLLSLAGGRTRQQTADALELHVRTVTTTRAAWLEAGLASLGDLPRSGRPRKLSAQSEEDLAEWAQAAPLSAPQLAARLADSGAPAVHLNTVRKSLRRSGLVARRTRHSLRTAATRRPSSGRA